MVQFDEHEFDEGLRRIAEGQGVEPPPGLYNGIRSAALERQLIRYQSTALWLKGTIGVLAALLGITGVFLYQARNEPTSQAAQAEVPAKTDTVYVTRTERVFTDRPVVVYVAKELTNTLNQNINDETNTLIASKHNGQSVKVQLGNPIVIDAANSQSDKPETNGNDQMDTIELNTKSDKGIRNSLFNQKSAGKSSTPTPTENSGDGSKTSTLEPKNPTGREALFETNQEERWVLDVSRLNALPLKSSSRFKSPKIAYRKPIHLQLAASPKGVKIRSPLSERLSLSAYLSPDWNKLDVRRDEPDAFTYGDEELQTGILVGIRGGLKLSEKWSLLAGAEFSGSSFDDGQRRQVLTMESVNGKSGFPYRTALGTVVIPADLLSSPPATNDRIGLEVHEPILRYALNLPIALRYDFWRKRFMLLNQVPLRFAVYGLLGGYAQIPLRQEGKVTIFEESGRELEAELTGFQNLRSAYGLSLGAGTELGVSKHLSIFTEPTYSQGLSSVVRDMPLRTTISGFGVKVGAKWGFGSQ